MTKIKDKLKDKLFKSVSTLEDRIKHKLNLVKKEDVLAKAYTNKQLNLKHYEAFDDQPIGTQHTDPHWGNYNSDVFVGINPKTDLEPGIGGKNRTTKVMRVVGDSTGKKAVIKTPLDWRELGLVRDQKTQSYKLEMEQYKRDFKEWANKRNTAVVLGESFNEPEPQKPKKYALNRLSETSAFLHPEFRSTHREVAFDLLANKVFDLGQCVAKTGMFRHPKTGIPWSAQEYIEGRGIQGPEGLSHHEANGDLFKLAIMDTILGNNDRHWGNMKVDQANNLKLIDNGGCFDFSNRIESQGYPKYAAHLVGKPLPVNVQVWIRNLNTDILMQFMQKAKVPESLAMVAANRMQEIKNWNEKVQDSPGHATDLAGAIDLAKTHRLDLDKAFLEAAKEMIRTRIARGEKPSIPGNSTDKTVLYSPKK